jgi:hypothetical protein
MNRNQKIVIFIALILFLCCGVFVPYDGTEIYTNPIYAITPKAANEIWNPLDPDRDYKANRTDTGAIAICRIKSFAGYFPIFKPPVHEDILKSFKITRPLGYFYNYESSINISRLTIQFFVLLILTIGLVLVFADSKHKHGAPK